MLLKLKLFLQVNSNFHLFELNNLSSDCNHLSIFDRLIDWPSKIWFNLANFCPHLRNHVIKTKARKYINMIVMFFFARNEARTHTQKIIIKMREKRKRDCWGGENFFRAFSFFDARQKKLRELTPLCETRFASRLAPFVRDRF